MFGLPGSLLGSLFVLYLVENGSSVVYNGYCKILRTDRRFRLKVLNFYGGAGIGKSTIAADIFSKLKRKGHKTELVGEYAKWLWYQNATDIVQDQLYLFAEQVHRLKTLERYGVEYAVCDSPLPLNIIYNNTPDELFDQLVLHEHAKFDNVEYILRRNDEFISIDGRNETNLERAKEKDEEIRAVLDGAGIEYTVISPWKRKRIVDFNQGIDSRLVNDENMHLLSQVNITPLRIAFDHWKLRDVYVKAVKAAVSNGIKGLSNYLLYNFNDKPEELYYRLQMNVNLCDELGANIYSFPMKYHPIDDPDYFRNRDFIGKHWNRKFIRAVQAILNSTKGKVGRGREFFEEAFGQDIHEFHKLLWMPETFIIYRRKYDAKLRERLAERYIPKEDEDSNLANEWWEKFSNLPTQEMEKIKPIIESNDFDNYDESTISESTREVLNYYKISR